MRVGIVSSTYPPIPGGMEVYVQAIAHALSNAEQRVTVATRFAHERPDDGMRGLLTTAASGLHRVDAAGVRVTELAPGWRSLIIMPVFRLQARKITQPLARWCFNVAYGAALKKAFHPVDVIHYSGTGRELIGFVALQLARSLGIPFVVTPHTHADSWGDAPVDLDLYCQADAVVALTEFERQHLSELGVPPERIHVIGHGVSVEPVTEETSASTPTGDEQREIVFFLGRKSASKGFGALLEAAPTVWQQHPEVTFVFAGPDAAETDALRRRHSTILNDNRVQEYGFIPESKKEDLFSTCDIFCLPSEAEAYGLVYLEAWAYGKPVVARSIPTLSELIPKREGGLLVGRDAESVAEALDELLQHPTLRNRLGDAGRERVKRQTWHRVAEQLVQVYRGVEKGAAPKHV